MTINHLEDFAKVCESIRATSKKLEKIDILAQYLLQLNAEDLPIICRFLTGHVFPSWIEKEVYTGYSTLVNLITEISGTTQTDLEATYLKYGDLGSTAEELLHLKPITPLFPAELSIMHVYSTFEKMAAVTGVGSTYTRRSLLKGLLLNSTPLEAKYLIKILTGELRIGLDEGLLVEALAKAFKETQQDVRNAYFVIGDIGNTAVLALEARLKDASLEVMRPTNFMLADTMHSTTEIAQYFDRDLYAEYKYDGVRAQIHKYGDSVKIFSRKLTEISNAFPEILSSIEEISHNFILDGEIVPFKDERPQSFQTLQHRLRRRGPNIEAIKEIPVKYFTYDLLYFDGRTLIGEPLSLRRRLLELLRLKGTTQFSKLTVARSADDLGHVFDESKNLGFEGLVVKNPESRYTPGRRGRQWVKLKKELDTLDVVVVAAEYGQGKRAGLLSDYTFAVRDGDQLKIIGRAYSGLTDEEILDMTKVLKETTIKDLGYKSIVKPTVVIEVAFDNIQQSDRHDSGYALRFPRITRIRLDKRREDIDVLNRVKEIYQRRAYIS